MCRRRSGLAGLERAGGRLGKLEMLRLTLSVRLRPTAGSRTETYRPTASSMTFVAPLIYFRYVNRKEASAASAAARVALDRHFDAAGARAEAAIGSASPFLSAPSPLIVMSHVLSCLGVSPSPSLHAALRKKWREGRGREGFSKFISPVLCLKVGLSLPTVAESPLALLGRRGSWTGRLALSSFRSPPTLSARYARFPSFDLRVALTNKGESRVRANIDIRKGNIF